MTNNEEETNVTQPELEDQEIAENGTVAEDVNVTPASDEPEDPVPNDEPEESAPSDEEVKKAVEEVKAKEDEEAQAFIEEQKNLEEQAKAEKPSEGSEIAAAIREGMNAGKEDKRIRITADKSVKSMFSVVRSKNTGEVMLRENATGVLSKVQLRSIEEKEADLQKEEFEEI